MAGKYTGEIRVAATGEVVPEGEWAVFRYKDAALPMMLAHYHDASFKAGAGRAHLDEIQALLEEVLVWQRAHPEQVKTPD